MPTFRPFALLAFVALAAGAVAQEPVRGLRVPAGFEVTEFADASLANDIYCMTISPDGRVVVSGRGYVRILEDTKNAGKADRVLDFAHAPKDGAMGLCWDGDDLYMMGDGGLRVFRKANGEGRTRPSELLYEFKTGGEHTGHAIARGPDGWLYVLCGDGAGVSPKFQNWPRENDVTVVGGCVLRFSPDFRSRDVYAQGFRNPYAFDFNPDGDLFTYDSDNERCMSLPWYEPTRLYHVQDWRAHTYGWLGPQRCATWRYPDYFPDVLAPIAKLGRGSPTGVACYRHVQFPEKYRGGLFLADWTFGRIYWVELKKEENSSTYTAKPEVFLQATGDSGFAPTALAVHPKTGDLFVSTGGRGTRGAVYRIRYPKGVEGVSPEGVAKLQPKPRKGTAWSYTNPFHPDTPKDLRKLSSAEVPVRLRIAALRREQQQIGDIGSSKFRGTVWEGYSRLDAAKKVEPDTVAEIRKAFPTGEHDLDRELSRFLAMVEDPDPESLKKVSAQITEKSHPTDDFHHLIVLSRLPAPRTKPETTRQITDALVRLDAKCAKLNLPRERNWFRHLVEVHGELAKKDPALNKAILAHPDFGRPEHVLFTEAPGFDRRAAAERFVKTSRDNSGFVWSAPLVELMGQLPPEQALPLLRKLWGEHGQDEAILKVLARHADKEDAPKFLDGLASPGAETVEASLDALAKLSDKAGDDECLALILALGRLPEGKETAKLADKIARRLTAATGQKLGTKRDPWAEWFVKAHPDKAAKLADADGVDVAAWKKRLAGVDWDKGDPERGAAVFTKASCATCHGGSQALGPDLVGVTGRFSRDDLFTAILQPSKDVSPRYRTTLIVTDSGKVVQGIIVYEAVDSLILHTGPGTTVRLTNPQVRERRQTNVSLMPAGLLDKLTDAEIADLYASLRANLSGPKRRRASRPRPGYNN